MSELPSRVDAADWARRYDEVVNPRSMVNVVEAFGSGRLFDRDTIDYEAEARKVHALVRSAYNQFPDEPRKPWDDLDEISKSGLIAMARNRINVAIGGSDEK